MALIREWMKGSEGKVLKSSNANAAVEKCLDCIKEYFDCTICRDPLDKPIQTQCGHVFCGTCLKDMCGQPNPTCPLCKKPISNRTLIARDDVGDMMELVDKLGKVFSVEVNKFLNLKETNSSDLAAIAKKSPKVPVKSPVRRLELEQRDRKKSTDRRLERREKTEGTEKIVQKMHSKPKSNVAETAGPDENVFPVRNEDNTTAIVPYKGDGPVEPKSTVSKSERYKQMMNQKYVIMTAEAVPWEPLDLSLPRKLPPKNIKYEFNEGPIRFVKPMDLSMKSEKRKLDETDEAFVNNATGSGKNPGPSTSGSKQGIIHPQHKRGKFEERKQDKAKESQITSKEGFEAQKSGKVQDVEVENQFEDSLIDEDPPVFTPTPPPAERKIVNGKSSEAIERNAKRPRIRVHPNKEAVNQDDEDDFPIDEDPPVFTPTPPPAPAEHRNPPGKLDAGVEKIAKRPRLPTQNRSRGATPNNDDLASSEIMRQFELPFEEEEEHSSGGKITSSDEILSKIIDEPLVTSKAKIQADARKNEKSFVFKQPVSSLSQAPKKKSMENNKMFAPVIDYDDDDDFQQPRDSDLMFLDLSISSGGRVEKKKAGKKPGSKMSDTGYMTHGQGSRRLSGSGSSGSDGEKENGKSRASSSRIEKKKTPVKSKSSTSTSAFDESVDEDRNRNTVNNRKSQKEGPKDVYGFEDDDDDGDWLLDIPEPSNKPKSGKSKQEVLKSSVAETSEEPMAKQRYVFCPTRLSKSQTINLQKLCKMCDGQITKEFTEEVTHLVINLSSGRVPQTLKYLQAIAGRKWVVIYDWVEKCVSSGEVVSEGEYETSNFKQCDPGVKRSRLAKTNLFDGFKFYFSSEIYKSMGFTKGEVTMLMETLGATVVDSAETRYRDLIIIGSMNGNSIEYNDWLNTNKWVTVTFEWVIECILDYRLKRFEPKHLCVDTSKVKSINAPKSFQTAFSQYLSQRSPRP